MEIKKEDLESYIREEMKDLFSFAVVTKDGLVITKYGDNYYMETSTAAASHVLSAITAINTKTD